VRGRGLLGRVRRFVESLLGGRDVSREVKGKKIWILGLWGG
jgi:hypothetical protein